MKGRTKRRNSVAERENFTCFIGVDQTGATGATGKMARPLAVSVLLGAEGRTPKLVSSDLHGRPLTVPSFTYEAFVSLLRECEIPAGYFARTAILVDAVMGLPQSLVTTTFSGAYEMLTLMRRAAVYRYGTKCFGREIAEAFFLELLGAKIGFPKRRVEELSGSNSVFQARPYQKNVQTGTFRIWKDIGADGETPWFNLWPFELYSEPIKGHPWVFEGWPTHAWRTLFSTTRKPGQLKKLLKKVSWGKSLNLSALVDDKKYPDSADASALAILGWQLQENGQLFQPFPKFNEDPTVAVEGWITGVNADK